MLVELDVSVAAGAVSPVGLTTTVAGAVSEATGASDSVDPALAPAAGLTSAVAAPVSEATGSDGSSGAVLA